MQQRSVGASGLRVSRLGLGTMTWGRDTDEHEARDQLVAFVGAGGTLLDTAAAYGDGVSEQLIGSLLGDVVAREDVVLATKAGLGQRRAPGRPGGGATGTSGGSGTRGAARDTSRRSILASLDGSLRRLGTDHVDLLQVHVWSDATPLEETLATLDHVVATGRARYVGVSNYTGWQTAQAATWQRAVPGRAPLVSTQVEYSLLNRNVELEVLPAAGALGMGALTWSPLGRGVLTGKYRTGTPSDSRAATSHLGSFVEPYLDERSHGIVESVVKAADGLGWTPAEVALAWVRDRPGVAAPVVGARTAAQLRALLSVEEKALPIEIADALDDVSAVD
ncbi:MAG: aldo/keto reductase [Nocardioides alkalitolerans]